jgi:ribosome-binding factor A
MILMTEISDPRLSLVTVTGATVSRDRSVCNVYISAEADRYDEVRSGLESAKGRIRSILGRSLGWRVTPELRFHIDTTIDEAERIAVALQNAVQSIRRKKAPGAVSVSKRFVKAAFRKPFVCLLMLNPHFLRIRQKEQGKSLSKNDRIVFPLCYTHANRLKENEMKFCCLVISVRLPAVCSGRAFC